MESLRIADEYPVIEDFIIDYLQDISICPKCLKEILRVCEKRRHIR